MLPWIAPIADLLWQNALGAIPLTLVVAGICRWGRPQPTTRHALWAMVLLWLVVPPLLPDISTPGSIVTTAGQPAPHEETRTNVPAPKAPKSLPTTGHGYGLANPTAHHEERQSNGTGGGSKPHTRGPSRATFERPATPRELSIGFSRTAARDRAVPKDRLVPGGGPSGSPRAEWHGSSKRVFDKDRDGPSRDRQGAVLTLETDRSVTGAALKQASQTRAKVASGEALRDPPGARSVEPARPWMGAAPIRESSSHRNGRAQPTPALSPVPDFAAETELGVVPAAKESAVRKSVFGAAQRWLAAWGTLRGAIAEVPRIPSSIWIAGVVLALAFCLVRVLVTRRHLVAAYPASAATRRMVRAAARRLGLRYVPDVSMVRSRVGPMLLCGRATRLILPVDLWSQLDRRGKEAILCHEMAHLRRRDHWLRRGELIIAVMYWWHPLVWWIRRRLHEEAEYCCDAWVTWVMPHDRRAYAQALLEAKSYLGVSRRAAPIAGIGVISGRAARLARRITMVMTGTAKPGLSVRGVALVVMLAMVGWVASPAKSCPDSKSDVKAPCAGAAVVAVASTAHPSERGKAVEARTTYERHVADRERHAALASQGGHEDDLEDRIERLERMIEKLAQKLEQQDRIVRIKRPKVPAPVMPPTAPALRGPDAIEQWRFPGVVRSYASSGEITRAYTLPKGKLGALTKLLARSDVPLLVRPGDDRIEVIGTEAQHAIFKCFVEMITSSEGELERSYRLPEGKLDALTALMSRSDVPILISDDDDDDDGDDDDEIEVHGTKLEQAVFAAFVGLIHPDGERVGMSDESESDRDEARWYAREARRSAREYQAQARMHAKQARKEAREAKKKAKARKKRKTRTERTNLRTLPDDASGVLGTAKSVALLQHLSALQERQHVDRERDATLILAEAASLRGDVERLSAQAERCNREAESMAMQMDTIVEESDSIEAASETLTNLADFVANLLDGIEGRLRESSGA